MSEGGDVNLNTSLDSWRCGERESPQERVEKVGWSYIARLVAALIENTEIFLSGTDGMKG